MLARFSHGGPVGVAADVTDDDVAAGVDADVFVNEALLNDDVGVFVLLSFFLTDRSTASD